MKQPNKANLFAIIGPGLLVAATGIGAGDLATASFAGSILGTAVLWAAVVGALLKFVVTEGLARWQLATGDTLLEGVIQRIGKVVGWLFLPYLFIWSFFVASALMSACGVTLHAMIPLFEDATQGKIVFGALSSIVGVVLVLIGGYELFDKIMRACIGLMFVTVVVTAALLWPGTGEVLRGLFVPSIPDISGQGP
jgi:Mn2+/Fe2+ NRAMP family transporter